ncbi:MAG: beta-N-acetylhexosaminidase [Cellulosilyticaceae bacterium]
MYLIPNPKSYRKLEGKFKLNLQTEIILGHTCSFEDLESAKLLQEEIVKEIGIKLAINKSFIKKDKQHIYLIKNEGISEAYKLEIISNGIIIEAGTSKGIFYGVQTLRQIIRQCGATLAQLVIEDEPHFKNRGFYHDVTRGKVPTLTTLKELVDRAAFYKLNQIQLYIEHTFAFKGMSEVWIDKNPLTAEEILELDRYCQKRHIELVPSIATFGHLYEVLRTQSYHELCELENSDREEYSFVNRMLHHTLDVSNPGSIEIIREMLTQFIPLFTSTQFNICCDETFDLGKGRSRQVAEEIGVGRLYTGFLNQVIDIVKGHNKQVMFWGDVILHYPELLGEIPEDVICLTWDYAANVNEKAIQTIAETGRMQYVCPGVGGWNMMMNLMDNAFTNIKGMAKYGQKHGAIGLLNTDWGDYGHVNLLANSIPGMAYGASMSWNPEIEEPFEETYKALSCIEYGDESLQLVGILNELSKNQPAGWGELIRWKENYPNQENAHKPIAELQSEKLLVGYNAACEAEEQLIKVARQIRYYKEDLQEFVLSARAHQLMDAYFLVALKYEMNQEGIEVVLGPKTLAGELEIWFTEYEVAWRKRNKESELGRIRQVIMNLCKELRNY